MVGTCHSRVRAYVLGLLFDRWFCRDRSRGVVHSPRTARRKELFWYAVSHREAPNLGGGVIILPPPSRVPVPRPLIFLVCVCVCVCVCVYIFIKLHITAQSDPVILVILCHSH